MPKEEAWHRRNAANLVGQLPEGREDALLVLDAMRDLVDFIHRQNSARDQGPVLAFSSDLATTPRNREARAMLRASSRPK